jgi:hypothetical protein
MTQLSANHVPQALRADNIRFTQNTGAGTGRAISVAGILMIAACAGLGFAHVGGVWPRQALAAYHVGAMAVLAICLGATFFVMIFHLMNAGWTGTIRRQFENVMSFLPVAWALAAATPIIDYIMGGTIFTWMNVSNVHDYLLAKKGFYFFGPLVSQLHDGKVPFPAFFFARAIFYGLLWFVLSRKLLSLSLKQDEHPSSSWTAKARFMSSWGILTLALSTAFCAFDWLKGVDYRFFSTMWGVYYFAGGMFGAVAVLIFILGTLVQKGKLAGAVTKEHFHDMGKLMFAFTVFWAYIGYSQYFLIWYSNIPEETAFYNHRVSHGWSILGTTLIIGHFVVPFLLVMSRVVKKNIPFMRILAAWAVVMHVADIYWILRPMVYVNPAERPGVGPIALVDALGILGVVLVFAGYLVTRIGSHALVAVNDPRMNEALEHRNYV